MTEYNCSVSSLVFRSIREAQQFLLLYSTSLSMLAVDGLPIRCVIRLKKHRKKLQVNNEIVTAIYPPKNITEKSNIIYVTYALLWLLSLIIEQGMVYYNMCKKACGNTEKYDEIPARQ